MRITVGTVGAASAVLAALLVAPMIAQAVPVTGSISLATLGGASAMPTPQHLYTATSVTVIPPIETPGTGTGGLSGIGNGRACDVEPIRLMLSRRSATWN